MNDYTYDNNKPKEAQYKNNEFLQVKQIHFELIDSTNSWAKTNFESWQNDKLTVITASQQSKGRGRFNRLWHAPKEKNIYATFCFFLDPKKKEIKNVSQVMAVTVLQLLAVHQIQAKIKWPNDLLVNDKKISGILCETIQDNNRLGVICGVGINVKMKNAELEAIDQPATSMEIINCSILDLKKVTENLVSLFQQNLQLFLLQGFEPFFPILQENFYYKVGDKISIQEGKVKYDGRLLQLHEDGSMSLLLERGQIKRCFSGEIVA